MVGRDVLGAPRPRDAHGNATCTRAAGDVGPYHASPMSTPYALSTPMVGRDVLGAPRPQDAHGTPTGTPRVRGPPRTSAPTMPHPCLHPHVLSVPHALSTPMVGRDVLGAPRPRDAHRDAHGTPTGTPHVRGPPGTSAPTMPHPCPRPTSCRHHMVGRDVLGAPRPLDAHGTPTGRHVYTGRRGRRPLPCLTSCPHPTPCPHPLAGDDVRRRL